MKTRILFLALCAAAGLQSALAETIVVDDQVKVRDPAIETPAKGMSMSAVEQRYGAPAQKHAAVGGGSAKQPPITRWDYAGFSVFFERDTVIHSVATG
jgi:hypothetical protein